MEGHVLPDRANDNSIVALVVRKQSESQRPTQSAKATKRDNLGAVTVIIDASILLAGACVCAGAEKIQRESRLEEGRVGAWGGALTGQ